MPRSSVGQRACSQARILLHRSALPHLPPERGLQNPHSSDPPFGFLSLESCLLSAKPESIHVLSPGTVQSHRPPSRVSGPSPPLTGLRASGPHLCTLRGCLALHSGLLLPNCAVWSSCSTVAELAGCSAFLPSSVAVTMLSPPYYSLSSNLTPEEGTEAQTHSLSC